MSSQIDPGKLINDMRTTMERVFSGSVRYTPLAQNHGFGLYRGGLSVAYTDPSDPWFLYLTAGIAANVTNIPGALAWVNDKNSELKIGRYYASIPEEGPPRCNVVYQCNAFSQLLSPNDYIDVVMWLLRLTSETSDKAPAEFLGSVGGDAFEDSPESISLLMVASFA